MSAEAFATRHHINAEPVAQAGLTRARIVAAGLSLGALASLALGIWHPEPSSGEMFNYADIAPIRDAWWAWHVFGGVGMAVSVIAVALAVCLLAPRRGSAWANIGAVVVVLGGLSFAAGIAAEGVLFASITDPAGLPAQSGEAFMIFVNENPERYLAAILPGILLLTGGALLLSVALWRAHSVPRWVPLIFAVTTVAGFVAPFGTVSDLVNGVFTVALLAIAWYAWCSAASSPRLPANYSETL